MGWQGETYDPIRTWGHAPKRPETILEDEVEITQREDTLGAEDIAYNKMVEQMEVTHKEVEQEVSKERTGDRWIEQLSWEPRAYLFHAFLSDAECDHIISLSRPFVGFPLTIF